MASCAVRTTKPVNAHFFAILSTTPLLLLQTEFFWGCSTTASAHTVLSQTSAKGLAQLKHQKLRVGDCAEVVLECCICARKWTDCSLVAKLLQCLLLALSTNYVVQASNAPDEATDGCV